MISKSLTCPVVKMDAPLKKHKILLVDDHPVFCYGMSELINKEDDLVVCDSIESMQKTSEAIARLKPDLVVVDISLKDGNGIDLVQEIKKEYGLPMLVLSMYDESLYAERSLLAGASGYIMKQEAISLVVEAIRRVLSGDVYASNTVKEKVFKRLTNQQTADSKFPLDILTNRELEVFRLIGEGFSTKEIADRLHLSIKTIGTYRENLKEKLKLKHFTDLVKFAVHWSNQILH
jgi:DNA-binding NarL/FixJ family response regulator